MKRIYIYVCIISIKINSRATKTLLFNFFNYQITKETTVSVKKMFKIKHEMHEKNAEKVNIACFVKVWNNILNILFECFYKTYNSIK